MIHGVRTLADRSQEEWQSPDAFKYLEKLHLVDYETLLTESMQPFPGTGNWLFFHQPFIEWTQEQSSRICWIRGSAGFGKTVIARSLVENCKLRTDRIMGLAPLGVSVMLHYFFRNEKVETLSQSSLLSSLLHQLLLRFPHFWSIIDFARTQEQSKSPGQPKGFNITSNWLWSALETVLADEACRNCLIVLDALDELNTLDLTAILERLSDMVEILNQSHRSQRIKIVVFSRPMEIAVRTLTKNGLVVVEMDRTHTMSDLQTFVSAVVSQFGEENAFPEDAVCRIRDRIISGADGMFLWAHLAWEHFKQGVTL